MVRPAALRLDEIALELGRDAIVRLVEAAEGADPGSGLAEAIEKEIRARLVVRTKVEIVEFGSLPRTDYKTKLVATADN